MLRISPRSFLAWFWDLLFFGHFSKFSHFSIFPLSHVPIFHFFHVFHFLGLGRGDVFPKYGVGRCFPVFGDGVGGGLLAHFGAGGVGVGFLGLGGVSPL